MNSLIKSLLLLCVCCTCSARLGDTVDQAKTRYGAAAADESSSGMRALAFVVGDYTVTCMFIGAGVCQGIQYKRSSGTNPVPDDIKQAWLKANAAGKAWKAIETSDFRRELWLREDGTRAIFDAFTRDMMILTPTVMKMLQELREKEKSQF